MTRPVIEDLLRAGGAEVLVADEGGLAATLALALGERSGASGAAGAPVVVVLFDSLVAASCDASGPGRALWAVEEPQARRELAAAIGASVAAAPAGCRGAGGGNGHGGRVKFATLPWLLQCVSAFELRDPEDRRFFSVP